MSMPTYKYFYNIIVIHYDKKLTTKGKDLDMHGQRLLTATSKLGRGR